MTISENKFGIRRIQFKTIRECKYEKVSKLAILFFSLLISFESSAQTPTKTVPNFTFFKLDSTQFTNKNLAIGKETLFIFFDVTCDHCRNTIKALNTRIKECKDISVYLISLDNKIQINNFLNQYGKNLADEKNVTVLQDLKNQFIPQFGPRKYPSIFLYSSENKLILYGDEDQSLETVLKIINVSKK
jgi:peroxiredoxin